MSHCYCSHVHVFLPPLRTFCWQCHSFVCLFGGAQGQDQLLAPNESDVYDALPLLIPTPIHIFPLGVILQVDFRQMDRFWSCLTVNHPYQVREFQ